jgi:IclR family transcriptional regulator, pca regulon regulatory protein
MGRVLLAGLDADSLDERLGRIRIEPLTPTTAPDVDALRERIDVAREAGWAAVDQELEQGVRSVAVPIRDASGVVAAALNVSVHATRMTMQALRRNVVPKLLKTAEAIEIDLSAAGSPGASSTA